MLTDALCMDYEMFGIPLSSSYWASTEQMPSNAIRRHHWLDWADCAPGAGLPDLKRGIDPELNLFGEL